MGFLSRQPNANEVFWGDQKLWGGDELMDDVALLLNDLAKRCAQCERVIRNKYLREHNGQKFCPDCLIKIKGVI